jgi:hypothetical protein
MDIALANLSTVPMIPTPSGVQALRRAQAASVSGNSGSSSSASATASGRGSDYVTLTSLLPSITGFSGIMPS